MAHLLICWREGPKVFGMEPLLRCPHCPGSRLLLRQNEVYCGTCGTVTTRLTSDFAITAVSSDPVPIFE